MFFRSFYIFSIVSLTSIVSPSIPIVSLPFSHQTPPWPRRCRGAVLQPAALEAQLLMRHVLLRSPLQDLSLEVAVDTATWTWLGWLGNAGNLWSRYSHHGESPGKETEHDGETMGKWWFHGGLYNGIYPPVNVWKMDHRNQ